jgi:hypothetical protein
MGDCQIPYWLYELIVVLVLFVGLPGGHLPSKVREKRDVRRFHGH